MKKIKAILFDMDGVLVKSEPAHADAWFDLMRMRGLVPELTLIKMENYIGVSDLQVAIDLKKYYQNLFPEEATQLVKLKKTHFLNLLKRGKYELPVPAGRDQFLELLKEKGIICAVVSSCSRLEIEETLKQQNILNSFRFYIGIDDISSPKPNPEPYLLGLKKLNLKNDEVVVIEDSLVGVTAARSAGIFVLGMATSYQRLDQFPEVIFYRDYNQLGELWKN